MQTFLPCHRCDKATVHTLLCTTDSDNEYFDVDGYKGVEPATYNVFRCDGCTRVSVYIWSAFHSPQSRFGEQEYPDDSVDVYGAPTDVRVAYQQAERVRSHSKVAYMVLARRVLDAIVRDRYPQERNLSRAICAMVAKGEIPPLLAEVADHIRVMGNRAAHRADADFNELHAQMIQRCLQILVDYLYVTPSSLQEFKILLGMVSDEQDAVEVKPTIAVPITNRP